MFLALALIQPVAWAETCKYLDSEGRIIYSNTPNTPPKGASKVKCFEDPVARPPNSGGQNADTNAAGAPKTTRISPDTQKSRDSERRRILEQELADETQQLAQAKEQLAAQEAIRNGNERNYERVLERLKPYQDAIATHGRNIEAIQREIANLK
jgi:plasmid stability protein